MTALTHRFTQAVDYVRIAHANQIRKGSEIPYIYHLLGVASLVIEHGGTEDQGIAALLHDVVEDCGKRHEHVVRAQFGEAVADIVMACTDGDAEGKAEHATLEARRADWLRRKLKYLAHLRVASADAILVSACDKLHNARAILQDLENSAVGDRVFERFTPTKANSLAYYHSLSVIYAESKSANPEVVRLFKCAVAKLHKLAGSASLVELSPAS